MFSSTSEYALRAVAYLATHPERPASSEVIASATQVPQGYLQKILTELAQAGIVEPKRGPAGGFTMLRSPDALSVLEVINVVDPIKRIVSCPLGIPSHGTRLCKLHRRLDDAIATVERVLADATIADMVERGADKECSFPLEPGPPAKPSSPVKPTVRGKPPKNRR